MEHDITISDCQGLEHFKSRSSKKINKNHSYHFVNQSIITQNNLLMTSENEKCSNLDQLSKCVHPVFARKQTGLTSHLSTVISFRSKTILDREHETLGNQSWTRCLWTARTAQRGTGKKKAKQTSKPSSSHLCATASSRSCHCWRPLQWTRKMWVFVKERHTHTHTK